MKCAITDGEHAGQRRATLPVDEHTIASDRTSIKQRSNRWRDANPYDHHLRRHDLTACETDTAHLAPLSEDAVDGGAKPHFDTVRPMLRLVEARQRLARDPREDTFKRFQQDDALSELGENRGSLKSYVPSANHHCLRDAVEFRHHAIGVGSGTDGMYADKLIARA